MKQIARHAQQQGLTLIELMVVLAIIGILAMVGATQYQDYVTRARVVEGLNLAAPYKLAVAEAAATSNGTFEADKLGLPAFVPTGDVQSIGVSNMTAGQGGIITIIYGPRVGSNSSLILTPTLNGSTVQWRCAAKDAAKPAAQDGVKANDQFLAGTLESRFAPASCR